MKGLMPLIVNAIGLDGQINGCITIKEFLSRPASQNTGKRSRDESRRRIYARRIPYVYTL